MRRPAKISNLMGKIQQAVASGHYLDTRHAQQRKVQRMITRPEILHVLTNGYHEKRKDVFEENYNAWNYAIRGKTTDKRELRVIVSFDENNMLIITAIDLSM